jgi:predicted RNA-binding protein Jag
MASNVAFRGKQVEEAFAQAMETLKIRKAEAALRCLSLETDGYLILPPKIQTAYQSYSLFLF